MTRNVYILIKTYYNESLSLCCLYVHATGINLVWMFTDQNKNIIRVKPRGNAISLK